MKAISLEIGNAEHSVDLYLASCAPTGVVRFEELVKDIFTADRVMPANATQ